MGPGGAHQVAVAGLAVDALALVAVHRVVADQHDGVGRGGWSGGGFSGGYYGPSSYRPMYAQPYYDPVPVAYYVPTPQPAQEQLAFPSGDRPAGITLRVPAGAQVFFDGDTTRQTGAVRRFVSPPLPHGSDYHYAVRVEWKEGGQSVTQTRRLTVHAGDQVNMSFGQSRTNEPSAQAPLASGAKR
jgi:uncharacterized protein (TIGR03000 family)